MSEGPMLRDPWRKREAWRKTPEYFSKTAMFRQMFPGFGIALVAFTGYVIFDNMYTKTHAKDDHHQHH